MSNDPVAAAKNALADLETALARLEPRRAELVEQRRRLAFDAHAAQNPAAQKSLRNVNASLGELDAERASIEEAIAEAQQRVAAAEDDIKHAGERAKARTVKRRADEIERLAREADQHGQAFKAALAAMLEHAHEISISGVRGPGPYRGVQLALGRAMLTALHGLNVGVDLPLLPPSARRTFAATVESFARSARGGAAAVLGESADQKSDAA
jgi:hypothetical protein